MTIEQWNIIIVSIAFLLTGVISVYSWSRVRLFAVGIMLWFALALFASSEGFFQNPSSWSDGDLVGFSVFGTLMTLSLLILLWGWIRSPGLREFLNAIPLSALIGIEIYRVGGAIFLWMYVEEMMPPEMGLFTGFMDIFIGVTALPLAWAVIRGIKGSRQIAIIWNVIGISDFMIAISMVSLSIFGIVNLQPDPVYIGLHPLALIALFQLPLSIAIHVLALRRLVAAKRSLAWSVRTGLPIQKTVTANFDLNR